MKDAFYFSLDGTTVQGPTTLEQLKADIEAGILSSDLLISDSSQQQWASLPSWERHLTEAASQPSAEQVGRPPPAQELPGTMLGSMAGHITRAAGMERIEGFKFGQFFAEVFSRHPDTEVESLFCVGALDTTPSSLGVQAAWPRPWMFARVLMLVLAVYFIFLQAWGHFHNVNLIPAILIVGSFAVPLSVLVLFFEINVWKNVSLYSTLKWFLWGGVVSLVVTLFLFDLVGRQGFKWFGASIAGPVEELAKVITVALVVREHRHGRLLNALLAGAAVGAGFAAFESAGYALRFFGTGFLKGWLSLEKAVDDMNAVITARGVLSPLCHIPWTAISTAALWQVRNSQPFQWAMLLKMRFLRVFLMVAGIHMAWNSPWGADLPFFAKYVLLGAVAWVMVLAFVQSGLREIAHVNATTEAATAS